MPCSASRRRWRPEARRSHDFLNQIFEPTRYQANATLRGFYFTSGTQQGTPIDQLLGAMTRSFGLQRGASAAYSGRGKSFFLERSADQGDVRRGRLGVDQCPGGAAQLPAAHRRLQPRRADRAGALGAWFTSYFAQRVADRLDAVGIEAYATKNAALIAEDTIRDARFRAGR